MYTKYLELGLSVIPLEPNEKFPFMLEWSQFCHRLPAEEEAERWDRDYAGRGFGYGLCCGEASGVVAVDIDTNDKVLLEIAPASPVRKKGQKGETRFFKWSPTLSLEHHNALDIISGGGQTVLPPSIHPKTGKPYAWLTPDTLENFDRLDLPELDLAWVAAYVERADAIYPENAADHPGGVGKGGRNNFLKDVVWAKRIAEETEAEIVDAIYSIDLAKHSPRLFTDRSEKFGAATEEEARLNAWKFVSSVTRSFIGKKAGPAPTAIPLIVGDGPLTAAWKPSPWPEPSGLLKDIRDQILDLGMKRNEALALGGAIAIAGAALTNRVRCGETWPNVFVLNIARTGAGKSYPYEAAKRLFSEEEGLDHVIGAASYASAAALTKDLPSQRVRLDMIDECSDMFKMMRDGGVFQAPMVEGLCRLWAESKSKFIGSKSMGREAVNVWHPGVNVLFSTTPDGLKESISRDFVTKGLIPRCLIFNEITSRVYADSWGWNAERGDAITRRLNEFQRMGEVSQKNLVDPRPAPQEIPISRNAERMLKEYSKEKSKMSDDEDCEPVESAFLSRAGEHVARLALIHGALRAMRVEEQDVGWAKQIIDACSFNAGPLIPMMSAENAQESNVLRLLHYVKKKGSITGTQFYDNTKHVSETQRNDMMNTLIQSGKVEKTSLKDPHKPGPAKTVYRFLKD